MLVTAEDEMVDIDSACVGVRIQGIHVRDWCHVIMISSIKSVLLRS